MVRRATKKKARGKAGRRKTVVSIARILNESPIHAEHKQALTALGRAVKAQDRANAALAKIVAKKDAADARLKKSLAAAKARKTAAAKNAVVKARTAKSTMMEAVKAAKAAVGETNAAVKDALAVINTIKKKEVAKAKAVDGFLAKWEKAYSRKITKAAKKKGRRKKRARPKTAA